MVLCVSASLSLYTVSLSVAAVDPAHIHFQDSFDCLAAACNTISIL